MKPQRGEARTTALRRVSILPVPLYDRALPDTDKQPVEFGGQ